MDTDAAVRCWIDGWLRGWRALDAEPIVALYADDAFFLSHPFRKPEPARDYIPRALAEEEWGRAVVRRAAGGRRPSRGRVVGPRARTGRTSRSRERLLRFRDDGQCVEQRDAWAVADGRIDRSP